MGKHYESAPIPSEMRRNFDVYERINEKNISLGTFESEVVSLTDAGIARVVIHESGLVYMSGIPGGSQSMTDDEELVKHGTKAAESSADSMIKLLHWALSCGGEGDLNDVLYTVKALGMVVSPGGGKSGSAPQVTNGFSFRWHTIFGGPKGDYAKNGIDPGGFSGIHARSAIGGFDGYFSVEPEMIVAIPSSLASEIISHRGWLFPLTPEILDKVKGSRR